ncbi:MAG: hypothetical protein WCQ69_10270 [Bacteroidales bacterium]|jgi:hypothetical protein|nr:hypothetical protein [Bacteroidales bacterium]MDY0352837.1 hypothetical protein [Bacteroidales bacterium]HHV03392.1 hypothetical protein [Bacteroidales bacterium]
MKIPDYSQVHIVCHLARIIGKKERIFSIEAAPVSYQVRDDYRIAEETEKPSKVSIILVAAVAGCIQKTQQLREFVIAVNIACRIQAAFLFIVCKDNFFAFMESRSILYQKTSRKPLKQFL